MKIKKPVDIIIYRSPTGRYVCYNDVVGRGAYKIVYRGYDRHEGREVAWNLLEYGQLDDDEMTMILNEVMILKTLTQCKYIINFCSLSDLNRYSLNVK